MAGHGAGGHPRGARRAEDLAARCGDAVADCTWAFRLNGLIAAVAAAPSGRPVGADPPLPAKGATDTHGGGG